MAIKTTTTAKPVLASEHVAEFLQRESRLFDDSPQGAGLERLVHGHHDGARLAAQDAVRAGLANFREAEAAQCAHGFLAVHIARDFHATASSGSLRRTPKFGPGAKL